MSSGWPISWDPFEDEQIRVGYQSGEKVAVIAHRLHRNYGQIASRANQLGLRHKRTLYLQPDPANLTARPVDEDLAQRCLDLFRGERMDTLAIARHLGKHEAEVARLLHHAREAERA